MITKLALPIDVIPVLFDTLSTLNNPEPTISTEIAVEEPFVSIKERESFFTRFKGTMEKQIMWHEQDLPNAKTIRKFKRKGRLIEE